MPNIEKLEGYYKKAVENLHDCLPEGVIHVDLAILQNHDLLDFQGIESHQENVLTRYFHVIESEEKITLINDQFVIWIVPEAMERTLTLIALNNQQEPKLELVFSVSGVYNNSRLVLRILEKFLHEIQENEEELSRLEKAS